MSLFSRLSVKEKQQQVREDALLDAAHSLLASKGYEHMTVDDVASEAGVAKASVYKHFVSKEALAAAVMIRLLDRALEYIRALPPEQQALDKLQSVLRWALELRLHGGLPLLPSSSEAVRQGLLSNRQYVTRILALNEAMLRLVDEAKAGGHISAALPSEVMLFSLYARTCDPSVDYIKMTGHYTDSEIVNYLVTIGVTGLITPPK